MRPIVLIHGIRTRRTSTSWPKALAPWLEARYPVRCEAVYYEARALPWLTTLRVNPRIARDLRTRLAERFAAAPGLPREFDLVAHSNGCEIALRLLHLADREGWRCRTAILTGAAIQPDPERSGVQALLDSGALGRAIAWSSDADWVVRLGQAHPSRWGELGATGWVREERRWPLRRTVPVGLRVEGYAPLGETRHRLVARLLKGYSHGQVWDADERVESFPCVAADLGLAQD